MLPPLLESAYGVGEIETRLLSRRKIDLSTGCWNWTGARNSGGYGLVKLRKYTSSPLRVHRLAAMLWGDFDPTSPFSVMHICDNPACFRPEHLRIGTASANARDRAGKARHGAAKLTLADAMEIRRIYQRGGITYASLASAYAISSGMVAHIIRGRKWTAEGKAA